MIYGALAIHATVSDVLGVRYADPSDRIFNTENIIFFQVITKGFLGRLVGPIAGRLSVVGQFAGFSILVLVLVGVSELLTVLILERKYQSSDPSAQVEMAAMSTPAEDRLGRRSRLRSITLHRLTLENAEAFMASENCRAFARMKHGDGGALRSFGRAVAELVLRDGAVGGVLTERPDEFCLIAPAYRKVPTVGVY